jgi:hypothetical protein
MSQLTNFIANKASDLGNVMLNKTTSTLIFPSNTTTFNKLSVSYTNPTIIKTNDIVATMDGFVLNGDQVYTFGPQTQRRIIITGTATNYVIQSTDGVNYYGLGAVNIVLPPWAAASSDSLFLIGGSVSDSANILYSYDGITYNSSNVSTLIGTGITTIYGLGYNGKQWISGGNSDTTNTNIIIYSYDGLNWIGAGLVGSATQGWTASYNGSYWVTAVNTSPYLAYSQNGITWNLVSGTTGFSGIGGDKNVAWNGVLWVACGTATSTNGQCLAYTIDSTGGTGWRPITLSSYNFGSTSVIYSVVWNGKMFLAIGFNNNTGVNAYSYNGINWTTYNAPFSAKGRTLTWTGNMWIHSGNNKIIYSFDGINWHDTGSALSTNMYASTINIYKPHSITFQRNLTIATGLGTSNRLAYSLDGINWIGLGLTAMFTTRGLCARYNGRVWVAGGEGGNTMAYSYDGVTWNGLGSNIFTQACFDIVWNGTLWVGCGSSGSVGGNTLAYSYDGLTWITNVSSNTCFLPSTTGGQSIAWNGSIWVAIGNGNPNTAYSYNGITWIPNHLSAYNGGTFRIISTNTYMFLLGGDLNNSLYYSYDGLTWSSTTISALTTIRGVYWYNNMWVITGKPSSTFCFVYSYDGINWLTSPSSNIYSDTGFLVTHNGTVWIATGGPTSSGNTLAYSYDGINWIGVGSSIFSSYGYGLSSNYQINPIPYIQHPTIAVGQGGNTIAYSETGINWKGLGSTIFSQVGNAVSWNGSIWVAGGKGGNTLAYSQDGLNWNPLGSSVFTEATNAVSWNNSYWVASGLGRNTLAYSTDGIKWTGVGSTVFTSEAYGVVWNGQTWIAGGQGGNTIAYSTNSITWTGLSGLPLNTYVTSIATNGPLCVATGLGDNYTLAYTLDPTGKTGWTGINKTIFSSRSNKICWNGSIWVSVGQGTNTIAYSYTGISGWVGIGMSTFSTRGLSVCWNGVRFIAVGQGGNSIAYSQNGINWYSSYNGFSTGLSTNIFTYGNCVSSNSTIGAVPMQSQLVLNKNIGSSDTLEVVSSDPYYQTGFDNVSIKIEPNNIYNSTYISLTTTATFTITAARETYLNNYDYVTNITVLSFITVQTTTIIFTKDMIISYLIVGGGGGGGTSIGKGGDGGEVRFSASYTITPNTPYTITIGSGGTGSSTANVSGVAGGASLFGTISSAGGSGGTSALKPYSETYTINIPSTKRSQNSVVYNNGGMYIYDSGSYLITFDPVTKTEANADWFYIYSGTDDQLLKRSGTAPSVWTPVTVTSSNGIYFVYTTNINTFFEYGVKFTLSDGSGASATYFSESGGNSNSATGGTGTDTQGGNGAAGVSNSITGTSVSYGGGGGGSIEVYGTQTPVASLGGTGGGGNGAYYKSNGGSISSVQATSGTANTGGGGGGGDFNNSKVITAGGNGGSGIVIISFTEK